MKDCTKQQYTKLCLDLIEMRERIKTIWATVDINVLDNIIEIVRFYRQFAK